MERVNLFLLHGFLGRPADWAPVQKALSGTADLRILTPDYFNIPELGPRVSLREWGHNFCSWAARQQVSETQKNVLVGYSLGGRLALHALESQPELWSQVIVLSSNPGFQDGLSGYSETSLERQQRKQNDLQWAQDFTQAPWSEVLGRWNAQPVFSGSECEPQRREAEYSRELLSLALTEWSLAGQKDLRSVLRPYAPKVKWFVGERDLKYVALAQELVQALPGLVVRKVAGSSHRILFDRPDELGRSLSEIVSELF